MAGLTRELIVKLTNDGTLVVLIWVESTLNVASRKMVVRLLDHVMAVGNLALFECALVDVDVGVIL